MTTDEILTLATAYAAHESVSLSTVGLRAANNNAVFRRIRGGHAASSRTVDRAAAWFAGHWPDGLPWPAGILHPHRPCCGAAHISAPANATAP